jgi:hypothetical protein
MPTLAKTKKKSSGKEARGDGEGFEVILSVKRKSPTKARTKSKVAGSKKKTFNAAAFTSEEPTSPESDGRKCPPEQLVALEKQRGRSLLFGNRGNLREWKSLMFLQAKIPGHQLTGMVYPFVSSAMRNVFVLPPLHANYAVIQKHMYHLTTLVNMMHSLLKLSIEVFSVR